MVSLPVVPNPDLQLPADLLRVAGQIHRDAIPAVHASKNPSTSDLHNHLHVLPEPARPNPVRDCGDRRAGAAHQAVVRGFAVYNVRLYHSGAQSDHPQNAVLE